jgi:hypothetical protein
MARRKINIQRTLGAKGLSPTHPPLNSAIDQLTGTMSSVDMGFRPTDQRVYEINLERISPDPLQPRHILPYDLRELVHNKEISPAEAMKALLLRAERGEIMALLVLGGREKGPVEEIDDKVEDTGLFALARSIREIGLRQPLNVYQIDDPDQPDQIFYRLGEGERRYWAHHLLVLQGNDEFRSVRCIVETLPDDEELIHQRQEAENAARVDLPALARARSIKRIKDRLNVELGTRVPGENTLKLPGQRELQVAVGQRVKSFTGRAISDRMVRNYLSLLNLPAEAQDLAEAGQLTEKQLRPVIRLKSDDEQIGLVKRIIEEKWSGRQVLTEITAATLKPKTALREVSQTTVEQRFEKRVLDAAKTLYALSSLDPEHYDEAVITLALRARDGKTKEALHKLQLVLEDILRKSEGLEEAEVTEVTLLSVIPPLTGLKNHLPPEDFETLDAAVATGAQILEQLLKWQREDAILASRLEPFFNQVEYDAEALRAGELVDLPVLRGRKRPKYPDLAIYEVASGASIYWAHELLIKRGESQFRLMRAELVGPTLLDEEY